MVKSIPGKKPKKPAASKPAAEPKGETSPSDGKTYSVKLGPKLHQRVEQAMADAEITSNSEFLKRCVTIALTIQDEVASGRKFVVQDDDGNEREFALVG